MTILAAFLFAILFVACGKDDHGNERKDQQNEQTIILFYPWSGSAKSSGLYAFIAQNVREVQQAIVANKGFSRSRFICFMSNTASSSVLLEMRYSKGKCLCDTLQRYQSLDFSDQRTLEDIFNTAIQAAPAERYAMMVGGHGSGWLPSTTAAKKVTRFIGGFSGQFATDTDVFAKALKATGQRMEFVLFDNCYMANIEVAYDLRESTDFMIASTSEIIERGIPYDIIFKYLVGTPDYQLFVQGFKDFYTSYVFPYGALSAIDCTQAERMADVMRRINARFSIGQSQLQAVQRLDGYSPAVFFDMADYVHKLCTDESLLQEFDEGMQRLVPYAQSTPNLFSEISSSAFRVNLFSGITISDPSLNEMANRKDETNWYKSTH